MNRLLICAVTLVLLLVATAANAHKPSDSYLSLTVEGATVEGRWDLALRDLDHALGLDGDGDRAITWGEVKAHHEAIAAYALARLQINTGGPVCATVAGAQLIAHHSDGAYAVLRFAADCGAPLQMLDLRYDFLFDLDPLHRGLVRIIADGVTQTKVLGPNNKDWRIDLVDAGWVAQFASYVRDGMEHILIGIDHVLFLILLLLPAVLRREDGTWRPVDRLGEASLEVIKVVSAFTIAHSLTLGLAAFEWIALPARLIEVAIAASVVAAAWNNLYPVVTRRSWLVAFGFGLIHGLGFASVLRDLGLPGEALVVALLGFNLGVEIGQLAIVAMFVPLAFALRAQALYPRMALQLGSLVIMAIGVVWLLDRAFGLSLAPI